MTSVAAWMTDQTVVFWVAIIAVILNVGGMTYVAAKETR